MSKAQDKASIEFLLMCILSLPCLKQFEEAREILLTNQPEKNIQHSYYTQY